MTKTIYLDPGHGGLDAGAVNGRRYEKNDNLKLAKAVKDKLVVQGHIVLMTREEDTYPTLAARIAAATAAKADIFVSLHRNSHTTATANGFEIHVRERKYNEAAISVHDAIMSVCGMRDRGVIIGKQFEVLYNAPMPAMLVETGFISNTADNELFDARFDKIAEAMAKGILAALDESWKESGKDPDTETKPLYRVQVGAFGVKENADNFLKTVQNMGLSAFIVTIEPPKGE